MYAVDGFERRLLELRKQKKLTQEEVAERLGVTAQAVSKWENGLSYPDITLFPAVAAVFEVSIDELFGKKTDDKGKTYEFPTELEGMPFLCSHYGVACYSGKEGAQAEGSGVKFADGSTAELSNMLIINRGRGEIRLLRADDYRESDEMSEPCHYEFPEAHSLDMEILCGCCEVSQGAGDTVKVHVSGSVPFVRYHRVSATEGVLAIRCDNPDALQEQNVKENQIRIELPRDRGNRARVCLNGSGNLDLPIFFQKGDIVINGSGCVHTDSFDECKALINGSGDVRIGSSGTTFLQINGSGDISTDESGNLTIDINGSGDMKTEKAVSIKATINGSGDIHVGTVAGGDAALKINGSGDITIENGDCGLFSAKLSASGDVDAAGLTARKADIVIERNGNVTLGRVLESSSEQAKRGGKIRILARGAI